MEQELNILRQRSMNKLNNILDEWVYEYTTSIKDEEIQIYYHQTDNKALIINKQRDTAFEFTEDEILYLSGIVRFYQDIFYFRNKAQVEEYKNKNQ